MEMGISVRSGPGFGVGVVVLGSSRCLGSGCVREVLGVCARCVRAVWSVCGVWVSGV